MIEVILKYAKDYGIDLEARNSSGRTPLHILYQTRSDESVLQFLEDAKKEYNIEFDVNAKANDGLTPQQCPPVYTYN